MTGKIKRLMNDIYKLSYPEEIKRFLPINHNDEIVKLIDWSYNNPDDYNTECNLFGELMDSYESDLDKLSPAMLIVLSMICDNLRVLHPECYNERYISGGYNVDLPYFKMFHDEIKWEINKRFLLHLSEMLDMNSQMLNICQSPKNRKKLRDSIKMYKNEIIKCREDGSGEYGYKAYRRLYNNIIN